MIFNVDIKDITSIMDPEWNSNEYYISAGEQSSQIYPDIVRTNFYLLFHIVEGWMDVRINDHYTIRVMPDMILAISPEIYGQNIACSHPYIAHLICFTKDFLLKNIASIHTLDAFNFFFYDTNPVIKLNSENRATILQLYNIIKNKRYEIGSAPHLDLIRTLFFSYLYEALIIYKKDNSETETIPFKLPVREMDIYMKFRKLISQEICYHRDLKFYANNLSVTPKHLIKLIKNITNQTPKKIIDESLLSISKYKLTNTDLTISLISEDLNFSDPAAFCKFFKKQTGLTPKKFRNITA